MVQMIMSSVCSAECDIKRTLDHREAIELWKTGQAIECVACRCKSWRCVTRSFLWDEGRLWMRWPSIGDLPWKAIGHLDQRDWVQFLVDLGDYHRWALVPGR